MQCVILAGGLATRMRPLTETVPKALIEVAGRPFAEHQLAWLARDGVSDAVFCIGYLGERLRSFVGDGARWGIAVRYADEGNELLGTAGALRKAYDDGLLAPEFAVLYGDSYLPIDISDVFTDFRVRRPPVLMTVYANEDRLDRSNARLDGGLVVAYDKSVADPATAGMRHIDYGLSIIDRDAVLPELPSDTVIDLAEVYRRLSAEGRVGGHEVFDRFYEIGSPAGLADLEALLSGDEA